ncbi:hypothetical protein E2C01_010993 [Portunus trituberculatus]|uniref:Uncharacterized protein n=1 Tax=Portunus trituberculatus TaxID=210409 RepID=A0A5B7DA88_PORTR|nr:hypothetical protein [Portunus trituberculatus]
MDVDVLDAVGDQLVNQQKYPHVFQWQLLVKSFSKDERGRSFTIIKLLIITIIIIIIIIICCCFFPQVINLSCLTLH